MNEMYMKKNFQKGKGDTNHMKNLNLETSFSESFKTNSMSQLAAYLKMSSLRGSRR